MKHVIALLALPLAGCGETAPADQRQEDNAVAAPVASPAAVASPTATAAQTVSADLAVGQWFAKTERGSAMAMFGAPYSEATFSVRCEGRSLVLMRDAQVPPGRTVMQVTAGGITRELAANSQQDPMPQVTAMVSVGDSLAGDLARTTEPVVITVAGSSEVFRLPSSPEFRGAVRSCIAGT